MRPTLEEQLRQRKKVDSMTDEELTKFFSPVGSFDRWLFGKSEFMWHLLNFNWFCIWCGKSHFRFSDMKCREDYFRKKKEGRL